MLLSGNEKPLMYLTVFNEQGLCSLRTPGLSKDIQCHV